jgi:phosphotransferase system enzyme I (PtsI)
MPEHTLTGVGVSPGRGAAVVLVAPPTVPAPAAGRTDGADPTQIPSAAAQVRAKLEEAARGTTGEARAALEATAVMATDPSLVSTAQALVSDDVGPARAVWEAATRIIDDLRSLGGTMAERAWDMVDVRDHIVARLTGRENPGIQDPGHPFVLVPTDLSPVDVATLDPERAKAIVTTRGGQASHTAIIARDLGIPAVVGVPEAARLSEGMPVVVDGSAGTVTVDAYEDEAARITDTRAPRRKFTGECRLADGHHVPLLANIGRPEDALAAAEAGAEGIGLFRTEFCFLGRRQVPTHVEQVQAYKRALDAFPGRTVVIRTLDTGSSAAPPFVFTTDEPNPALGVRGFRAFLDHPGVLDGQLAAIADAARASEAKALVMAPMVTTAADAGEFVARCARHGLMSAGVTIEVPAAALRAGQLLSRAAFASIGTNDLTQYTMAADRQVPELTHLCTPWQPAVLELIRSGCRAGRDQHKPVGVCGEAAADPALAVVLVGLGAKNLSMAPRALADVASVLATTTLPECRRLADLALAAVGADEARRVVRAELPVLAELGLAPAAVAVGASRAWSVSAGRGRCRLGAVIGAGRALIVGAGRAAPGHGSLRCRGLLSCRDAATRRRARRTAARRRARPR